MQDVVMAGGLAGGLVKQFTHPLPAAHVNATLANATGPVPPDPPTSRAGATADFFFEGSQLPRAEPSENGPTSNRNSEGNENAWVPRLSRKNSKHKSQSLAPDVAAMRRRDNGGPAEGEGLLMDELGPDGRYTSLGPESIRLGQIQGFGCLVLVQGTTFQITALSLNAIDMLEMDLQRRPGSAVGEPKWSSAIGMDVRTLLSDDSVEVLVQASTAPDLNAVCPIVLSTKASGHPYYAILRRKEHGLMIDFEPVQIGDKSTGPVTGALSSHKIAARAVTRLKSVPVGNLSMLCSTAVEEIAELTGYDRVMAYRFHADDHGEVVAECRNNKEAASYFGWHFPASDLPVVSRRVFMENRVRMIVDAFQEGVNVVHLGSMPDSFSLAGCSMRGIQGCHREYLANMGVHASLVLAITVNQGEEGGTLRGQPKEETSGKVADNRKLWGLLVCHHNSPCMVPYPTRSACEFLIQVFGVQLNKEMDLLNQLKAKHMLRVQSLLCDLLLRAPPVALVTQTPNISDLVNCDGATLLFEGSVWRLNSAPPEAIVRDIGEWLTRSHAETTGFSTDSLLNAGYPRAEELGEAVCGMVAVKFCDTGYIMWFRAHTAKEIKWGGVKEDEVGRLRPRASFAAFLETVKMRSKPWEDVEMDAVHSLQIILRGALQEQDEAKRRQLMRSRVAELRLETVDEINQVANEMVRIIETATVPILGVDRNGQIIGWNMHIAKITGVPVEEAMGRSLLQDLVVEESVDTTKRLLMSSFGGVEESDVEVRLKVWRDGVAAGFIIMMVNTCANRDVHENILGVCLVGQDITTQRIAMDRYTRCEGDYRSIIHSPNPLIPPIFGMDEYGFCSEWNTGMARLTGLMRGEAVGRLLLGNVFGLEASPLQLADEDAMTELEIVVNCAMEGHEDASHHPFQFLGRDGKTQQVLLTVNKRCDDTGRVTGVFCFLHSMNRELRGALKLQAVDEKAAESRSKRLAAVVEALKAPLEGIAFIRASLERSGGLTPDQRQLLVTCGALEDQMRTTLHEEEEGAGEGEGEGEGEGAQRVELNFVTLLNAALTQGSAAALGKGQHLMCSPLPERKERLFGDAMKLQQVLATCVRIAVLYTPPGGWVELKVEGVGEPKVAPTSSERFRFSVSHSGDGIPGALIHILVGAERGVGGRHGAAAALRVCRRMVGEVGGELGYSFEREQCCLKLEVDLYVRLGEDLEANSWNAA